MPKTPPRILVVDDQPLNVQLLERKLQREDMTVYTAFSGKECLTIAEEKHPDLILLDIMMPEMDGIEACKLLKKNPETKNIPVLFITAKTAKESRLMGLSAGGIDYITKPIDLDETLARIKTQLNMQVIYRENTALQQRLAELKHSATITAIIQGIAHNLNNLLGGFLGSLELLKREEISSETRQGCIDNMVHATQRMTGILRQLNKIAMEEKPSISRFHLETLLESSIVHFQKNYPNKKLKITKKYEVPLDFEFPSNAAIFTDLLEKLLSNALESYLPEIEAPSIALEVTMEPSSSQLCIAVKDRGRGIDRKVKDTLFEPFVSTKASVGSGLGLTIARQLTQTLKGNLLVESREGGGVCARICLPV